MSEVQGARDLQVYVADAEDGIWYNDATGERHCALSCQDFVKQDFVTRAETVQILGTPSNAELILALYEFSDQNLDSPAIFIGGPNQIGPSLIGLGPQAILYSMRGCSWPPSLGGWHRMTPTDKHVYELVDFFNRNCSGNLKTPEVSKLIKQHPAYAALSFLPKFNLSAAVTLLASIVDPRWRINSRHNGKPSVLLEFLGLLPRHAATERIRCYFEEPAVFATRYNGGSRLISAVGTWMADRSLSGWLNSSDSHSAAPSDYFFRYAAAARGSEPARIAAATAQFVTFVADVWLDNLTPARKYRQVRTSTGKNKSGTVRKKLIKSTEYSPTLFVPEHFFCDDTVTAASFKKHLCSTRAK